MTTTIQSYEQQLQNINAGIKNAKTEAEKTQLTKEQETISNAIQNLQKADQTFKKEVPSIFSESEQIANDFPTKGVVATAEGTVTAKQLEVVTDKKVIAKSELYNPKTKQEVFNNKFGCQEGNTKFVEEIKNANTAEERLKAIAKHADDGNGEIAKEARKVLDDINAKNLDNKPTQLVSKLDDAANAGKGIKNQVQNLGKNIGNAYSRSGGVYTKGNVALVVAGGAVDAGISMYSDYQENGTLTKEGSGKPVVKAACATTAAVAGLGATAVISAKIGAVIGTAVCPLAGTAAGFVVGAAIGAGCYYVGGLIGDAVNKCW